MIITCESCGTRFRFDVTAVEGGREGIWLRCSRCRHVFYRTLAPPGAEGRQGLGPAAPEGPPPSGDPLPEAKGPLKRRLSPWRVGAAVLLALFLFAGAVAFLNPPLVEEALRGFKALQAPVSGEKQLPGEKASVVVRDLRQRLVNNPVMGTIRVVEGMAVNTADVPLTRIKVAAELYDAVDTRVREAVAYCGNLLSDEELQTMTEEQILRELAVPQGTDVNAERVNAGAAVPFMIVFFLEPPGVVKTLVYPLQAERVLP
ncbi:MAG TPA: DUF3426 domain-containing protein [Syntrophales bacterium]|nr:DUF3426 domain-containing protein [Syntrophales bacterium]